MGRTQASDEDLRVRWAAMRPGVLVGFLCIVLGGLVAAVTGPTGFEHGSWAAAYLVLVAGVAQLGLSAGQALLPALPPTRRTVLWELATWNAGNVAVLTGTFAGAVLPVVAGGLALFVALVLFIHGVKAPRAGWTRSLAAYRLLAGVIAVSIPVGLVLSAVRHG